MWRLARVEDDEVIERLCAALYEEDPSPEPVPRAMVRRTLAVLRAEPVRGRAVVLEIGGRVAGYALLISFWSNELGGELCTIDELYVDAAERGRGWAGELLAALAVPGGLWPEGAVALELETTPGNERARRLYERAGFVGRKNLTMLRRLGAR
jgi:GNAT superfamily N-acetyltransferase